MEYSLGLIKVALCAAFAMFFPAHSASAQEVTLTFPDGSLELKGPLLGFDGTSYRLDTRFGVLTVAADRVQCSGDCPDANFVPLIRMAGVPAVTEVLMPALVDAFALLLGLRSVSEPSAEQGSLRLGLADDEGNVLARYEITPMSSENALRRLTEQSIEIALTARAATDREREDAFDAGIGDLRDPIRQRLLARRTLRVYEPLADAGAALTVPELADWLSGSTNGGRPLPAVASINAELLESAFATMQQRSGIASPGEIAVEVVEGPEALIASLGEAPAAIVTHAPVLSGRSISLSHGCAPGSASAAEGEANPLSVSLWAYTGAARLPDLGRAFLAYINSAEAQRVVARAGFLDARPRSVPLDDQGGRLVAAMSAVDDLEEMQELKSVLKTLEGHERLTTGFRFEGADDSLTPASRNAARSLAAAIDSGRFDGRELVFVGFSAETETESDPITQSRMRAQNALDAVTALMITRDDRVNTRAVGAGRTFPLDCEKGPWGVHVNRRVEVWVSP